MTVRVTNAGPERRHPPRPAHGVVPQHVVVGRRRRRSRRCAAEPPARSAIDHPFLGELELLAGAGPDGTDRWRCSARTRRTRGRLFGDDNGPRVPEGRHQRPRGRRSTTRSTRDSQGTKASFWYQAVRRPGATVELRLRLRPAGTKPAKASTALGRGLRQGRRQAPHGGRRVLRRADPGRRVAGRGDGHAPGVRRDAVEQAAVRLRRRPLARRRPDPAHPAGGAAHRPQLAVAQLRVVRHHVDARQVGVPVVRGLGPRVPLRRPRPPRPGVRQVPAAADLPGVVPAPQRRAARLRVGLRRRQPAGAGVGRARGVRHRRRPRPRLPQQDLRQAARQLHVVGEPRGRRRVEPVRRRLPRARQHRPDRPLAPAGRRRPRAVRRHRLDGVLRAGDGGHRVDPQPIGPAAGDRPGAQVPRALRGHQPGDGATSACGTRPTGCTTTSS